MKLEKQIRSHKKWIGFGILLVLSILLYIQHRHVYMYFDDYGYASLTYGNDQYYNDGVLTFSNLINYLVWHYNNWGGRILCFFLEISLLHIGVDAVRIVQSVLIAGILLFSVRLIRPSHKRWLTLLVLVLSLYFSWTLQVTVMEYSGFRHLSPTSGLFVPSLLRFFYSASITRRAVTNSSWRDFFSFWRHSLKSKLPLWSSSASCVYLDTAALLSGSEAVPNLFACFVRL